MTVAASARCTPDQIFGTGPLDVHADDEGAVLRPGHRRRSLDDVLVGAWEDLLADHRAACPVCTGPLEARFAAGPRPVAGRCRSCGSSLS